MKCAECKEREAAWEWPCIIVSHSQQEKDLGTQTQIKMHQTVLGLDNAGLCEECEKNHAKKEAANSKAIIGGADMGIAFVLLALFYVVVSGENYKLNISKTVVIAILGAVLLGLIGYTFYRKSADRKKLLARPLEDRAFWLAALKGELRYAPMGDGLYESEDDFKSRNKTLIDAVASKIYKGIVLTEKWKTMEPGKLTEAPSLTPQEWDRYDLYRSLLAEKALEMEARKNS